MKCVLHSSSLKTLLHFFGLAARWRCETAVLPFHKIKKMKNKKTTIHLHCPSRFHLFTSFPLIFAPRRLTLPSQLSLLSGCGLRDSCAGHQLHQASGRGPLHPSGPVEESPGRKGAGAELRPGCSLQTVLPSHQRVNQSSFIVFI